MVKRKNKNIRLSSKNRVVLAVRDLQPGREIENEGLDVQNRIRPGHEMVTREIRCDDLIRK